jgi:hypothetical protein
MSSLILAPKRLMMTFGHQTFSDTAFGKEMFHA